MAPSPLLHDLSLHELLRRILDAEARGEQTDRETSALYRRDDLPPLLFARLDVAVLLRRYIEAERLTQAAASERLGLSRTQLSQLRDGYVARVDLDALVAAAERVGFLLRIGLWEVPEGYTTQHSRSPARPSLPLEDEDLAQRVVRASDVEVSRADRIRSEIVAQLLEDRAALYRDLDRARRIPPDRAYSFEEVGWRLVNRDDPARYTREEQAAAPALSKDTVRRLVTGKYPLRLEATDGPRGLVVTEEAVQRYETEAVGKPQNAIPPSLRRLRTASTGGARTEGQAFEDRDRQEEENLKAAQEQNPEADT